MMSKKDYVRAGYLIRDNATDTEDRDRLIQVFSVFFAGDNPRFQQGLFEAFARGECGPSGGRVAA